MLDAKIERWHPKEFLKFLFDSVLLIKIQNIKKKIIYRLFLSLDIFTDIVKFLWFEFNRLLKDVHFFRLRYCLMELFLIKKILLVCSLL